MRRDLTNPLISPVSFSDKLNENAVFHPNDDVEDGSVQKGGNEANKSSKERLKSLDAFRGLVITVMILVDDAGDTYGARLGHSPWNNVTLADFVMPFFLFIVGVSMTLSFKNVNKPGQREVILRHALVRTARLFLLGLILQGADFGGKYNLATLRIPGILQRIAFAYLVVTLTELYLPTKDVGFIDESYWSVYKRYVYHFVFYGAFLFLYLMLMFLTPLDSIPACQGAPSRLSPQCNAAYYWDEKILGLSHMYGSPTFQRTPECSSCSPRQCPKLDAPAWCTSSFDPEGILSSLCAVLSTFLGLFYGHLMQFSPRVATRIKLFLPLSIILVAIGMVLHVTDAVPLNKNLYSVSYMLVMAGASGLCLAVFYLVIDVARLSAPFLPFIYMGLNAIFVFVFAASGVLETMLTWVYWKDPSNNLVDYFRSQILVKSLGYDAGIMVMTWIKIVFWYIVSFIMFKNQIFFKI